MPACQNIRFLWISLLELRLLHADHQLNQFLSYWLEHLASDRASNDSKGLYGLSFKLFVLFSAEFLVLEELKHESDGVL